MCVGELFTDEDDINTDATSTQTAIKQLGISPDHSSATLIPSTLILVLRGRLGWHQTKRERISKIIRKEQRKIAEEERKKKVP